MPVPSSSDYVTGWGGAGLHVGAAFGNLPFPSSSTSFDDRTWTNLSTSVRWAQTMRGRTHDLDTFDPGTATIVLDNRTRLYDPACTSGTHAGNVIPGVPVRVWMRPPGGTTGKRLFSGYAEAWQVEYPGMADATVTVDCQDGMKFLALRALTTTTTRDTVQSMIGNVLTAAEWPSDWRQVGVSLSSGANVRGYQTPALDVIRNLAAAEAGAFLVGANGNAIFRNRRWWVTEETTSKGVLSDTGGLPYDRLTVRSDDTQLFNRVRVTGQQGTVRTTHSTASYDRYGWRDLVFANLPVGGATESMKVARWHVQRYRWPGVRVERVEFQPRASTGLFDLAGVLGLGSRLTVRRHPPGGGLIVSTGRVEGLDHTVDVGLDDWRVGVGLAPSSLFPSSSI